MAAGQSLEALYIQHAAELHRYLRRMGCDAAAADDLLQETFVQAARFEDRLLAATTARAWLYGVARNLAGSFRRRLRRHRARPLPDSVSGRNVEEDPRIDAMRRAITRLAAPLRETLELRLNAELSYAEIAEALDVPIGTVRSRLSEAVQRLSEMLKEGVEK